MSHVTASVTFCAVPKCWITHIPSFHPQGSLEILRFTLSSGFSWSVTVVRGFRPKGKILNKGDLNRDDSRTLFPKIQLHHNLPLRQRRAPTPKRVQ